jgi:predicted nucleic acid-binding protein
VIVSGTISPIGAPRRLLDAWDDERFSVLLSDMQYDELVGVFDRPRIVAQIRFSAAELARLFAGLAAGPPGGSKSNRSGPGARSG